MSDLRVLKFEKPADDSSKKLAEDLKKLADDAEQGKITGFIACVAYGNTYHTTGSICSYVEQLAMTKMLEDTVVKKLLKPL